MKHKNLLLKLQLFTLVGTLTLVWLVWPTIPTPQPVAPISTSTSSTTQVTDVPARSFRAAIDYAVWVETVNSQPPETTTTTTVVSVPVEVSSQTVINDGELANHPFLVCTRRHESDTAGGYQAVSPSGAFRGAYQFHQNTWDTVAGWVGRHDLVGVPANLASPADQDLLAYELYKREGNRHWEGRC